MPSQEPPETYYRQGVEYYREKQFARAFAAFETAAAGGHAAAPRWLGYMYRHGIAVQQDVGRAIEFFEQAVTRGDVRAKGFLGQLLINGSAGAFLGNISHPCQVMRGVRLIFSGIYDVLGSRKEST